MVIKATAPPIVAAILTLKERFFEENETIRNDMYHVLVRRVGGGRVWEKR